MTFRYSCAGSILLELIIATAISAMLSIMLFNSLAQFNRGIMMTNDVIGRDARIMLFAKQFERDISGVFVPKIAHKEEGKSEAKESPAITPPSTPQGQPQAQQQAATPTKKLKIEPLEDAFYFEGSDKQIKMLSFVTDNPMVTYAAKPRMVRVIYTLELEPNKKNSYRLMREESLDIFYEPKDQKKSSAQFVLIDGIKELSIEFVTTITQPAEGAAPATSQSNTQKPGAPAQTSQAEPQKKEITVKEWPSKELEGKSSALIPEFLIVRLVIWDNTYKRDFPITYRVPAFAASDIEEEPKKEGSPEIPKGTAVTKPSDVKTPVQTVKGDKQVNNNAAGKTGGKP